jgi:hypothetical protein
MTDGDLFSDAQNGATNNSPLPLDSKTPRESQKYVKMFLSSRILMASASKRENCLFSVILKPGGGDITCTK